MIVFSSDNGPESSWKQRIEEFDHDSSSIYQGGKRDIYEGGHRVPFLVRWPAGIKEPGRRCNSLVGQCDLLATFAEIVGVGLPSKAGEDSQSFAKVLFDPQAKHERLPLINHASNGRFAITDGDWKLIMPHNKSKRELYDLSTDPGEEKNLFDLHPEIAESLEKKITQIVVDGRTTKGDKQPNDTGYWNDLQWIQEADYGATAKEERKEKADGKFVPDEIVAYKSVALADGSSDDLDLHIFHPPGYPSTKSLPCIVLLLWRRLERRNSKSIPSALRVLRKPWDGCDFG